MERLLRGVLILMSALAGGNGGISKGDVEKAIEEGRERVGEEFAELLTAPTMTEEEMAEAEGKEGDE